MADVQEIVKIMVKCFDFATVKHKNMRRKDLERTPYINHQIGVARILTEEAGIWDPVIIQAAILKDTIDDSNTTLEEIEQEFGKDVRKVVAQLTFDKALPKIQRKHLQVMSAQTSSFKARVVKLAEKLYNLKYIMRETPEGWDITRMCNYILWSNQVVKKLRGTNAALESRYWAITKF